MFRRGPQTGGISNARGGRGQTRGGGYSRGRGRGGSNRSGGGGGDRKRGGFLNGSWHCDCNPPLPAEHFRVKKDGPNHGRWFYTCQAAQDERCGFFLWDEDAAPRMEAAVLANARTEPGREADAAALLGGGEGQGARAEVAKPSSVQAGGGGGGVGGGTGDGQANPLWAQQSQSRSSVQTTQPQGSGTVKRKRDEKIDDSAANKRQAIQLEGSETEGEDEFDDDELLSWPATALDPPQTPRKTEAAPLTGLATPKTGRRLPWLDYSDEDKAPTTPSKTPVTNGKSVGLPTPSKTKESSPPHSKATAAIDARNEEEVSEAQTSPSKLSLQDEVLAVLSEHMALPERVRAQLLPVLSKHDLRLRGVVKGRDLVRAALRTKETKIVEMSGRIAGLEAEREVLLAAVSRAREESEL